MNAGFDGRQVGRDAREDRRAWPPDHMLWRLGAIGAVAASLLGGFAYTAGWLSPDRLSPEQTVDVLSQRGGDPFGHRRNHSKGVCFEGMFEATGEAQRLSTAPMLRLGRYPVIGRFAIAVGNPMAPDQAGRVRSMAVRITAPDGQEWRSGMNSSPVFAVATPRAFYEQALAAHVDPATGRPDPLAMKRFVAAHPETRAFSDWARDAPWTRSFADQTYNSLDAFRFTDATGTTRFVRWSMQSTVPQVPIARAALATLGPDFLSTDLKNRLRTGPLRWTMILTIAASDDPTRDPTLAWPSSRQRVVAGTLVVTRAEDETSGPCRDINYDPLVLPVGMSPSDDPILLARSPAYANSFRRREAEVGHHGASKS